MVCSETALMAFRKTRNFITVNVLLLSVKKQEMYIFHIFVLLAFIIVKYNVLLHSPCVYRLQYFRHHHVLLHVRASSNLRSQKYQIYNKYH
jgi:hypothetical protein